MPELRRDHLRRAAWRLDDGRGELGSRRAEIGRSDCREDTRGARTSAERANAGDRRMNNAELEAVVRVMATNPCFLCATKRLGGLVGIFIPDRPEEYCTAAPRANATRTVVYRICQGCIDRLGVEGCGKAVEEKAKKKPYGGPVLRVTGSHRDGCPRHKSDI